MTILVVCGLIREAKLAQRLVPATDILVGGGQSERLRADLTNLARHRPGLVLSAGLAGALDPALVPGDVVIDGDGETLARLSMILPDAKIGTVIGRNSIAADPATKHALAAQGMAVDMESHIAADVARACGLPFGVIRVISDAAHECLPPAALVGMKPNGAMDLGAVLLSLLRYPGQLPALIRTGRHAGQAFRSLGRAFAALSEASFNDRGFTAP